MRDQRKIKGEETKSKILNAAVDIISSEGISGLSTKRIAEGAGISKSNVFHHFSSVNEIMSALVCDLCNHITSSILEVSNEDLESVFDYLSAYLFNLDAETAKYYKVMYSFFNDSYYYEQFKDILNNSRKDTVKLIKSIAYNAENITISDDLAEMLAIDVDGMINAYLIEKDTEKFKRLWKIKSAMYIEALRKTSL